MSEETAADKAKDQKMQKMDPAFLDPKLAESMGAHATSLEKHAANHRVEEATLNDAMDMCRKDLETYEEKRKAALSIKFIFDYGYIKNALEDAIKKGEDALFEMKRPVECSTCGIKTFRVKEETGEKIPITAEGVLHGRCLKCHPLASLQAGASVASITFRATNNNVSPTKCSTDQCKSTKEVIQDHESFKELVKGKMGMQIIQDSSVGNAAKEQGMTSLCASGLLSAVLMAYNRHHNLVLRPDDVWQAILTQFSLYLTAHAEELRDRIVDFAGQKQLTVKAAGTLFTVDFGEMAAKMVDGEIVKNIKDPTLVQWLLPAFTTTTSTDRVAASVSVMSAMQQYFKYKFELCCGIPYVTLLGSVEDWQKLRQKVDGLLQFELEGQTHIHIWHGWLVEITDHLVESAKANADVEFWDRIAHRQGGGSGPRYVSGWIAAFAVWSDEGTWQGKTRQPIGAGWIVKPDGTKEYHYESHHPIINTNDLPSGVVSVPVLVDDNGKEYDCTMLSGQFGMQLDGCTVVPQTDWCIATELS